MQDKNNILSSASESSVDSEFYSPFPKGYQKGKIKYIIVAGSVMSGVGKGIFASSLAKLLQYYGLKVSPIKIDGYFNQDAGTLNPFRHGEVFVLDDGMECDMDLGSYERFLDMNLSKDNYLTAGIIFNRILERERKGEYLGRDVQFIPHVTGEIKKSLRELAVKTNADIVLLEIGGTIGDYENSYIIEAIRELRYEEGKDNVCFINVSYIIEPPNLGEQKSKPAQLGLNRLMALGLQPDMVVCRAISPVHQKVREKISVYSNVPVENVIGLHDTDTVYKAPLLIKETAADERVVDILGLRNKIYPGMQEEELEKWRDFVEKHKNADKKIAIGIAGKYMGLNDSYASILKAIEHASTHNSAKAKIRFIDTTEIDSEDDSRAELAGLNGLIVPGGFGRRGTEGKILCIKYARENNIPFLGLCYGFQMAVIEFARNICNIVKADSTEITPQCSAPVIDIMADQKSIVCLGGNMRLGAYPAVLKKESIVQKLYGTDIISERHRHRYEVNNKYISEFEQKGLVFSGKSPDGNLMEFLEIPSHLFFVATQAHPEFKSRPLKPSPLFDGFIKGCLNNI